MAPNMKKIFFVVFCLASVLQGMYSTYFVSILTTIERIYQIQSKTAGAIMSATEVGQILGSLLIAYYGGKGNKPKWMAACMTLTAIAALISTSPHFIMREYNSASIIQQSPYQTTSDLSTTTELSNSLTMPLTSQKPQSSLLFVSNLTQLTFPTQDQLCHPTSLSNPLILNSTFNTNPASLLQNDGTYSRPTSSSSALIIFFLCLLAIGFGSTAITTLGIPFIDDIVSKEESPLYLGLTIGLKIFGPALGFLLGSFCIRLNSNLLLFGTPLTIVAAPTSAEKSQFSAPSSDVGAWWLGPILISLPLLIIALPMYYLSRKISDTDSNSNDFEAITYQAAEDHDIGGSRDFQTHVLTICDLDVTSNQTCYSEVDSSSREVLQSAAKSSISVSQYRRYNFGKNLTLEQPVISRETILNHTKSSDSKRPQQQGGNGDENDNWRASCIVVNHFGRLESTSFTNDEAKSLKSSSSSADSSAASASSLPLPSPTPSSTCPSSTKRSTMDLTSSLSRLIRNKLLLLRTLSAILHILPIAGFYTFFPKYLSEQFRIAPSSASAISGLAGILFVGVGAFLGGTIVRVLNVNSKLMTRWIAVSALLYAFGMIILMNLGCPQNQTVYYESDNFRSTDCQTDCLCSGNVYNPVCANGTTYISPCLAGCKSYTLFEDKIIFDECGCSNNNVLQMSNSNVSSNDNTTSSGSNPMSSKDLHEGGESAGHINLNVATLGHCLLNCDNLIWYVIIFSVFTLIHATCEVGSMMFNLRCVKSHDRTLALGLITFSSSLLGTIPCSVIYGTLIDLTCVHWDALATTIDPTSSSSATNQALSETRGACRAYENNTFRYYLHGATAFVMFLAFIVDCIVSRRAEEVDFYNHNDHSGSKSDSKQDISSVHKKSMETI